jgi:hypothetical protein
MSAVTVLKMKRSKICDRRHTLVELGTSYSAPDVPTDARQHLDYSRYPDRSLRDDAIHATPADAKGVPSAIPVGVVIAERKPISKTSISSDASKRSTASKFEQE